MEKPFSPACERNRDPILEVLKQELGPVPWVLEVGSGTGQHAVYFTQQLPDLTWQTSELPSNMGGLHLRIEEANNPRLPHPLTLDVNEAGWLDQLPSLAPAVFTSNTFHIMSWEEVKCFFERMDEILVSKGRLIVYGPFNYNKSYTSESNARFDQSLRERDPESGIRDFEEVNLLANTHDFTLINDYEMPANNRTLVWVKNS